MHKNDFKSVYPLANTLYGVTLDESVFEDIALNGWALIGNRSTRLYRYKTNTENRQILLPCNVDFIEAVYSSDLDSRKSTELGVDYTSGITEKYIESNKNGVSSFYHSGSLITYRLEGRYLVFDRDYSDVTILYHGVIADDDGLPYLSDKEVQALAAYVAYADTYKRSLVLKDTALVQLAGVLKND